MINRTLGKIYRYRFIYLLLLFPMTYFVIFKFWPMYWLTIAFKDLNLFTGPSESPWVGFKHFISFFRSPDFFQILFNTIYINVLLLIFSFPAPIILALMLNEVSSMGLKKVYQTVTYIPYFMSMVVVVAIMQSFFSATGPMNGILRALGREPVYFLVLARYFRGIYVTSVVWQQTGWFSIIYLAALAGVDPELYDAATVDGAGRWRQLFSVTLPSIATTIAVMLILRIGQIMNVFFERIYLMGNPAVRQVAEVISTYVYRRGILAADMSYATAVACFNGVIGLVLVILANRASKKLTGSGIW